MVDNELIMIYKRAKYMVDIDGKPCRIMVNHAIAAIDNLLSILNESCAYFITPENPFSLNLSAEENELRHQRFVKSITAQKYDYYLGYGTDEDDKWGKEKSYLIICDDHSAMCTLASQFGQNGLLMLPKQESVKLLVLAPLVYKVV